MKSSSITRVLLPIIFVWVLFGQPYLAKADGPVGGGPPNYSIQAVNASSLGPMVTQYGKISLSLDAMGTVSAQKDIHVNKPQGGTVRKAFLLSASTGFQQYQLRAGDVKIKGIPITWDTSLPSSISSFNYWADITRIIKPIIDAAPAGNIALPVSENNTYLIDGEILAVIFDDPNQTVNSTVILYFGAQNINGDTFNINTGRPIDTTDPNFKVNLSLGISYGCQGDSYCAPSQNSLVDVNGQRLTSSAGGQDDGESSNGALITVGGIGDSDNNPADPNASASTYRSDDELYNLKPIINNGDSLIKIDTKNPSMDDNILFAAFILSTTDTSSTIKSIDLDISLYNNPSTAEQRAPYEKIINHFADAVYEESNGINKLESVTFHVLDEYRDKAQILWEKQGGPQSDPAGFGVSGKHIFMYDIFQDGHGKGNNWDFMADENGLQAAGYTLGHEFGHYYYSLYDEYVCSAKDPKCIQNAQVLYQPHSTDVPADYSVMNRQFKAQPGFLKGPDYRWLNFSVGKNTSGPTAQFRVYGAAGWDTLARSISQDPPTPTWTSRPTRIYHSELASVQPEAKKDPRIDLPGTARSEVYIVWAGPLIASPGLETVGVAASTLPFTPELNSLLGQNISYPDPIILSAFVHQDMNIAGLNVTGNVVFPDGSSQGVDFKDDGVPPDAAAGDGLYTALLSSLQNGIHTFNVGFDNHAGQGSQVPYAYMPPIDEEGNILYSDPIPVTEDFSLSKTLWISVGNVIPDDYGNMPDNASEFVPDNTPVSGKIDSPQDIDVFKLATLPAGDTFVRITNLALGMTPHLRILGDDRQTVLMDLDLTAIGPGGYLNIGFYGFLPGSTFYLEVSDEKNQPGGLYRISAGEPLFGDSVKAFLYLPTITH